MKTAQDFLKEANEIVEKIDTLDAIKNMVLMKQYL